MKTLLRGIGLVLALTAGTAQAIPTLYFDSTIKYDASTSILSLNGTLLNGSDSAASSGSISFSTTFQSVTNIDSSRPFHPATTKGNFTGNVNFSITGSGSSALLSGNITGLSLEGADGGSQGTLNGILKTTGGSLMNTFNNSYLFATQVDLQDIQGIQTTYGIDMYTAGFSGHANGNIKSVPEPTTLALLGIGILFIGFTNKKTFLYNK